MTRTLPLALALFALAGCAEEAPVEDPVVEPEAEVVTEPVDNVVIDSTLLEEGPAPDTALEEGTVGE
jgi:hypothetical protein